MVLTAGQTTAFFENADQMGIPNATVVQLAVKGILHLTTSPSFHRVTLTTSRIRYVGWRYQLLQMDLSWNNNDSWWERDLRSVWPLQRKSYATTKRFVKLSRLRCKNVMGDFIQFWNSMEGHSRKEEWGSSWNSEAFERSYSDEVVGVDGWPPHALYVVLELERWLSRMSRVMRSIRLQPFQRKAPTCYMQPIMDRLRLNLLFGSHTFIPYIVLIMKMSTIWWRKQLVTTNEIYLLTPSTVIGILTVIHTPRMRTIW